MIKTNDFILRSVIFAAVAGGSLFLFTAAFRSPASLPFPYSGNSYPQVGVSLFWQRDIVLVRVDDREEKVPINQIATSLIYQEAIGRIPASKRPALGTTVRWPRVLSFWLPLTGLTWWALFRLWQPPRPYIEGGSVV